MTRDDRMATASSLEADPTDLAVVAGATGAIGSALVRRLLESGFQVIGFARHAEGMQQFAALPAFEGRIGDVAEAGFSKDVAGAVGDRQVRLAVNAARVPEAGDLGEVAPHLLARGVEVKAGGLLRLFRGCDARLVAGSRLIGFGGRLGYDPDPQAPIASIANVAVASLVRQLAQELGPRGVTAHVVAPGPVRTDRPQSTSPERHRPPRDRVKQRLPLGRLPEPEEIVTAMLLLLGSAGDLLNGGTLLLDGGQRTSLP